MTRGCTCSHVEDEHEGDNPEYPGSTACTVEGCECVCFEEDENACRGCGHSPCDCDRDPAEQGGPW